MYTHNAPKKFSLVTSIGNRFVRFMRHRLGKNARRG